MSAERSAGDQSAGGPSPGGQGLGGQGPGDQGPGDQGPGGQGATGRSAGGQGPSDQGPGGQSAEDQGAEDQGAEDQGEGGRPPRRRRVVLALGSNLGDRLENLQGAVDALFDTPGLHFVAVSPVYETVPVGGREQPDYLNAVLIARTALPARTILERAHGVEEVFGRVREQRWGPRTLDVDVIVYGDEVSDDPGLTLPHPRAHERAFVLAPWHDIEPDAEIPGRGRIADLLRVTGLDGARRLRDGRLHPPA